MHEYMCSPVCTRTQVCTTAQGHESWSTACGSGLNEGLGGLLTQCTHARTSGLPFRDRIMRPVSPGPRSSRKQASSEIWMRTKCSQQRAEQLFPESTPQRGSSRNSDDASRGAEGKPRGLWASKSLRVRQF